MANIMTEVWSWTKTILIAVILALCVNMFVLQTYVVKGESMYPTLEEGERLFIYKFTSNYEIGEIVVVDSRVGLQRTVWDEMKDHALISRASGRVVDYLWIKRIIGTPGDTIEIRDGVLFRNGEEVNEYYIREGMRQEDIHVVVPDGAIYVLGDNRNFSIDSRVIGPVPMSNVLGKAIFK